MGLIFKSSVVSKQSIIRWTLQASHTQANTNTVADTHVLGLGHFLIRHMVSDSGIA